MRLDAYLVQKKIAASRERAKERIVQGDIEVNGKTILKPSHNVLFGDDVEAHGEGMHWVSRAALKLEHALNVWNIDVSGKTCLDIGASTGGFTEVLLSRGAREVYALDVGHDQLHEAT
jgi:23S rRNA (cytidine1920-2'-O)/16S rRNA (cytidine1409-2'-O)-methyltransferase